jgi:hypothetical protein
MGTGTLTRPSSLARALELLCRQLPRSIRVVGGSLVGLAPGAGLPRSARPAARILNPGIRSIWHKIRHTPLAPLSSLFLAVHHSARGLELKREAGFLILNSLHYSLITYMGYPSSSTRPRLASQRHRRRFGRTQVGKLPTSQKFCLRASTFIWYKQFTESSVWLAGRFCRNSRARPASNDV